MNTRINELMIEAFQAHYGYPVTPGAREKALGLVSGWGEKFAELIVRECLEVAHQEHKNALEFDWDNDDTAQTIRDSISEHFGVTELP